MLNPGQVCVDVADQPLFARSKEIQWHVAGYDKARYIPMMGAFHVEKVPIICVKCTVHSTDFVNVQYPAVPKDFKFRVIGLCCFLCSYFPYNLIFNNNIGRSI